jgi:hypothetical protein
VGHKKKIHKDPALPIFEKHMEELANTVSVILSSLDETMCTSID